MTFDHWLITIDQWLGTIVPYLGIDGQSHIPSTPVTTDWLPGSNGHLLLPSDQRKPPMGQ